MTKKLQDALEKARNPINPNAIYPETPPPPIPRRRGETDPEQLKALQAQIEAMQAELNNRVASNNALVTASDGNRVLGRFQLTHTALIIPEDISQDEMNLMGDLLRQMSGAMQFWIGDYVNMYHDGWGEMYDRMAEYFGIPQQTLEKWAWACRKIEKFRRRNFLSFSHHELVAGLPAALNGREDELLDYAQHNNLSYRDFRVYIRSLAPGKMVKPMPNLFNKEYMPRPANLKSLYLKARQGDETALAEIRRHITEYQKWLQDIEQSLGLR
jgi:hypothetical protein